MRKRVKGFTLIELIVVLAIFSIVMVAATSLMQPVSKIMVTTDVNDTGNSNVSQISKYLELSLGPAEYIRLAQFVPDQTQRDAMVKDFVDTCYSGILYKGSNTTNQVYANATIHVMTIDNAHGGKISEYIYECNLEPGQTPVEKPALSREYAVNKALYDNYAYTIYPGVSKYAPEGTYDVKDFMRDSHDVYHTSFSIDAETTRYRGRPNQMTVNFSGTATVVLSNINAPTEYRPNGVPVSAYFVYDAASGAIMDKSQVQPTPLQGVEFTGPDNTVSYWGSTCSTIQEIKDGGLCFVYAYGPEIVTGPKT
ncbi:MAG: prepilin-type N-terminal cleavage/methylation domain-containing protein [Oscillospiraceae bacterium]|nr:prepilin-type N-terminal cleavage/methylation domain-containing protein [Oscillospiraceae bacterium]